MFVNKRFLAMFAVSAFVAVSCTKGESPSGPGDTSVIQGISFVSIPGETFQMGDVEGVGSFDEKPVHMVTLSGFEISVYEITNTQYAQYLNDAQKTGDIALSNMGVKGAKGVYNEHEYLILDVPFDGTNKCWITFSNNIFTVVSGKEKWPVVYVTWYGAKAFALHYGLDLPTEAEWEYGCRGGKQYKYGTDDGTINSSKANYAYYIWDDKYLKDVGSYPKNPFGLYDMSGNVAEWCNDLYGIYPSGSEHNPPGAQYGSYRITRGGSWRSNENGCRSAVRIYGNPDGWGRIGFRVVRRVSP